MKRFVIIFGVISGVISSALMFLSVYLCVKEVMDFENAEVIGYSSMVLAFILVYFGVRAYRDNTPGPLTFGRAFKVGFLIVLISSAFYVVSWEIINYHVMPDFMEKFAAHSLAKMRADGASAEEVRQFTTFMEYYKNPVVNAAVTLIEPMPVGLLAALISAAILRRKPEGTPSAEAVAA